MRNKLIIAGIATSLFGTQVLAANATKEESVGVGVGATIGALAGGPVGFIVGAAVGARFGDNIHQKNREFEDVTASLEDSNVRVAELQDNIRALNGEITDLDSEVERLQETSSPELMSLLQAGIAMDLLFRTDEDVLSTATGSKLGQLATTLAGMTDVQIQLDGFADERGDAVYNQQLSVRRADHVRSVLLDNGIPEARIQITGHGEMPAVDANVDSYAMDRKVSLTLYVDDKPSFAANPK